MWRSEGNVKRRTMELLKQAVRSGWTPLLERKENITATLTWIVKV